MKYHNKFTIWIGILFLISLIYMCLKKREGLSQPQTYYDGYKRYLKENTNTTYDEYVGQERLLKEDSASAYIRNKKPVPKDIAEDKTLIDYFIHLFNKDSK